MPTTKYLKKEDELLSPDIYTGELSDGAELAKALYSEDDFNTYLKNEKGWWDAHDSGNKALETYFHDAQEQLRSKYNYSGGVDGSDYIKLVDYAKQPNGDAIQMLQQYLNEANAPVSSYQPTEWDMMREQLAKIYMDNSYDKWAQSDEYKALAKRYGQQGEKSMRDVLGQVVSRTGGLASSYAQTAAQQQYNEYMALLEDVARKQYSDASNELFSKINIADSMSQREYERYIDEQRRASENRSYALDIISQMIGLNQYNDEVAYNRGRDAVADQRYNDEVAYQKDRDAIADGRYNDEVAYGKAQDARSQAYDRIYDFLVVRGGSVGELDAELIRASGLTTNELRQMEEQYAKDQEAAAKIAEDDEQKPGILDAMLGIGSEASAYEFLVQQGLTQSQTDKLWEYYTDAVEEQKKTEDPPPQDDKSESDPVDTYASWLDDLVMRGQMSAEKADDLFAKFVESKSGNVR